MESGGLGGKGRVHHRARGQDRHPGRRPPRGHRRPGRVDRRRCGGHPGHPRLRHRLREPRPDQGLGPRGGEAT